MSQASGTQAIDRAAELLVRVVESGGPVGIGELAETSGLPKSTTSRLVGALERQGLLQRDGQRGPLRPGPVLLRFAHRSDESLVWLAAPSLRRLANQTGETINLAVAGPDGVEHLAQEDTAHFVGVTDWVGRRVPFEHAANGKVFLAFGDAPPRALAKVRAQGYATSIDELEVGLSAVAAPVFGSDGTVVAALSVSGPTSRLTHERIDALVPILQEESRALSARLGFPKRGAA